MLTSVYYLGSTVYYLGSFNPPTRGHLSAVQEVRKAFPAVKVLVHADDEVSVWKPNRIAWEIRTAMLEILFKDIENVTVVKKTRKEIQSVLKSAYIINLVGSDSWQFYKERDFVNEIVTIMREGDNFKIPVGVPHVTLLKPSIANLSSTFVRQNLSPEYLGKPLYDFIKRNLLYVQNRLPDILNGLGPEAEVFNRSGK
jgi:cytidyltransferase-like protein